MVYQNVILLNLCFCFLSTNEPFFPSLPCLCGKFFQMWRCHMIVLLSFVHIFESYLTGESFVMNIPKRIFLQWIKFWPKFVEQQTKKHEAHKRKNNDNHDGARGNQVVFNQTSVFLFDVNIYVNISGSCVLCLVARFHFLGTL